MDKDLLIQKIDAVVQTMKENLKKQQKKYDIYSINFKDLKLSKDENIKRYQYELEKYNYNILRCTNEINRIKLFINRCLSYKEYLNSIEKADIFKIKRCEYQFINAIQEETFFYYDSKIQEFSQRRKIEAIVEKEQVSLIEVERLTKEREQKLDMFQSRDFYINENKIYTTEYLDYDISVMVDKLYKSRYKKTS